MACQRLMDTEMVVSLVTSLAVTMTVTKVGSMAGNLDWLIMTGSGKVD